MLMRMRCVMLSSVTYPGVLYVLSVDMDVVHTNGHEKTITVILAKHCIELPDDGSIVIRNMLEQF